MNKNSEITSGAAPSPTAQRASSTLKQLGTIGFWLQVVLGIISTVLLLIAAAGLIGTKQKTAGIELGILCALCSVVLLIAAIYFSFRYTKIAQKLQNPDLPNRPKKSDTLQVIKYGLAINLVGMLLAILGAQALAGIVLIKALNVAPGTLTNFGTNQTQFVNSVDLLIVQANTNTISGHFAGIITSLVLLNRITK